MFLTRLRLDPRSAQARRDIADPYDMHRTLVRGFIQDDKQVPPRFLWRLEPTGAWAQAIVLVQATQAPDWTFLQALPRYLVEGDLPETKSWQPEHLLHEGAACRFRLVANPTVTRDGKRHGLASQELQHAWLKRQGVRHGFAIESVEIGDGGMMEGRKADKRLSLLRVEFNGMLRVMDTALVTQAVCAGIGPGKAFGCGLLSLARGT